jgi:hypothetical protein
MDLLISILFALGLNYSPADLSQGLSSGMPDENLEYAKYIRDNNLYHITAEDGVVIDTDVNP